MKTILSAAGFLAVLLFGTVPSLGQTPPVNPPCSQHPPVSRDEVKKARDAGHGIRYQYMLDDTRPPGREVPTIHDSSGGDCPADFTPRGAAAAAVGALLYNGQIHCSAVLVTTTMIVTAGHCIQGFDWHKLEFVLGLDSHRPVQRSSIYSAGVHSGYDEGHFGIHDIAYAYLNNQMTEATPVDVEENMVSRMNNLSLLHVGYGIAGAQPGARRCVNIPISGRCDAGFDYATANMNTCNGDSGGGAFSGDGNKILLAGMTDWGDEACAQFGVDVDMGYYFDWIQSRKSQAPRNFAYARVEPSARKPLTESPDEVLAKLDTRYAEAKFNSLYRGRWITWDATVEDVEPLDEDEIPGTCTLIATAGKRTRLLLHHYLDGCVIALHSSIRFTGRLARLGPNGLEVVLPEPVTAPPQTVAEAAGEYVLARLTTESREVRERRTREVRLESRHGSWAGRVNECLPVNVEAPWRLDRTAPIRFVAAHKDHSDFLNTMQDETDHGFCVPLWAEGYGGTQMFGATVDAGMVGVISGTVEFGVVKTETAIGKVPVSAGPIAAAASMTIPLPTHDKYELALKLRDGKEQMFSESGSLDKVSIDWAADKVELRSGTKPQ